MKKLIKEIQKGPSSLIVFGGRPGMGLTRVTLKIANTLAKNEKVLFISYQDHFGKLINILRNQQETPESNLKINTSLDFYDFSFGEKIEQLVKEHFATTIIIDDLDSLIKEPFNTNNSDKNNLVKRLSDTTTRLNVRIILNVTVSKKVEFRRGDRRPMYRDFIWSRNLCDLAHQVYSIYRPFYYGITESEYGHSTLNQIEIECLKSVNGKECSFVFDNRKENILPQ